MNIDRMKQAIALMEDAKQLCMVTWQTSPDADKHRVDPTIEALHSCDNEACFGGYLALSKEFREAGGTQCRSSGAPMFDGHTGAVAVAKYLDIPTPISYMLVLGKASPPRKDEGLLEELCHVSERRTSGQAIYKAYPVQFDEVQPQHVIDFLNKIIRVLGE